MIYKATATFTSDLYLLKSSKIKTFPQADVKLQRKKNKNGHLAIFLEPLYHL